MEASCYRQRRGSSPREPVAGKLAILVNKDHNQAPATYKITVVELSRVFGHLEPWFHEKLFL